MTTRPRLQLSIALLVFVLVSTACGSANPASEAAAQAPVVNSPAVVETVVAEVQARQPDVDATGLRAIVEAVVEERLAALEAAVFSDMIEEAVAGQNQAEASAAANESPTALSGLDLEAELVELYRRANPAVVYIIVPPIGSGSGFVYHDDGYVVTNNHVVSGGRSFEVVFASGERLAARLIGADADSDLAVLKVDSLPDSVAPLALAEAGSLQVGQFVVTIGNPFGEQGSMSLGIVSGLERSLRSQRDQSANSAYSLPSVIQTDAPINPGNSGGPLLNLAGEVVGVNSAIATTTGVNSGVGFSIPVIAVLRIVPDLITQGRHVYAYLGASFDDEISLSDQAQFRLDRAAGAYVVNVVAGGPADRAGLIPANPGTGRDGDLIIAIDDTPINSFADLNSYLVFNTSVGQTIELTVVRGGDEIRLPLTLGERP